MFLAWRASRQRKAKVQLLKFELNWIDIELILHIYYVTPICTPQKVEWKKEFSCLMKSDY